MEILYLYLFGIISVYYLNGGILDTEIYRNDHILIDYWFFVHVFNNLCLSRAYSKILTRNEFLLIPFTWEIIENIILPGIGLKQYKERPIDTIGDIISILPAYLTYDLKSSFIVPEINSKFLSFSYSQEYWKSWNTFLTQFKIFNCDECI